MLFERQAEHRREGILIRGSRIGEDPGGPNEKVRGEMRHEQCEADAMTVRGDQPGLGRIVAS